jgi:hypothetical protein
MPAIEVRLTPRDDVVPVWFSSQRYEKEPHLMLPLPDTLRAVLVEHVAAIRVLHRQPNTGFRTT